MRDARGEVRSAIEQRSAQPASAGAAGVIAAGVSGLVFLRSLTAFRQWLSAILTDQLLDGSPRQARRGGTYLSDPLRDAYETGLRQARSALRAQGYDIGDRSYEAVITDERHQSALGRFYERSYVDIEDALTNSVQETSRAIADGGYIDADAVNKRDLADAVNERLRANHGKRLSPLADTLPARAANTAAMVAYQHAGVSEVGIEPEASEGSKDVNWIHANDGNVCAECLALSEDAPYKLADVLAGNPEPPPSPHLRCRCFLLPL